MILGAVLALVFPIIAALMVSVSLPVAAFDLGQGLPALAGQLAEANTYAPVTEALGFIVAGAAFDLALTSSRFLLWLYARIPIFGKGE